MSAPIRIRPGTRDDWPHVLTSFAREYGKTSHGKPMGERVKRAALTALLESPLWTLEIACPTDEASDTIYGWMLRSKANDIAWLHVKDDYRGRGFARALLRHADVCKGNVSTPFDHPLTVNEKAWSNGYRIRYEPHLLLREIWPSETK